MVIKSPFKDYYDFVAHQYGGGDPRVVYPRQRVFKNISEYVEVEDWRLPDPTYWFGKDHSWSVTYRRPEYHCMYLVIAGKPYLLAKPIPINETVWTGKTEYNLSSYKIQPLDYEARLPRWRMSQVPTVEFGVENKSLINLSRKIDAPVFVIDRVDYERRYGTSTLTICGQCPILQRLGVPSMISPQQLYQDLAMFIGNRMKDTPDVQPPVELNNRQKIVKAGFDLIQSFRHRI